MIKGEDGRLHVWSLVIGHWSLVIRLQHKARSLSTAGSEHGWGIVPLGADSGSRGFAGDGLVHCDLSRLGSFANRQGDREHAVVELCAELGVVDRRVEAQSEGIAEITEFTMERLPGIRRRIATRGLDGEHVLIEVDADGIFRNTREFDLDDELLVCPAGRVARFAKRLLAGSRGGRSDGGGGAAGGSHDRIQGFRMDGAGSVHFDGARLAMLLLGQGDDQKTVLELGCDAIFRHAIGH